MEVVVNYGGKTYQYTQFGNLITWVDDQKMMVPVMLHSILRERAIENGTDPSVFLQVPPEVPEEKVKPVVAATATATNKKKTHLQGAFNPFNK